MFLAAPLDDLVLPFAHAAPPDRDGRTAAQLLVARSFLPFVFHGARPSQEEVEPSFRTGEEAFAMWRMLCENAKNFRVEARDIEADDTSGKAHWDAYYTFSKTGRPVINRIDARFTFRDGKLTRWRVFPDHESALAAVGLAE